MKTQTYKQLLFSLLIVSMTIMKISYAGDLSIVAPQMSPFIDMEAEDKGPISQMTHEVFSELNLEVDIFITSKNRAYRMMRRGMSLSFIISGTQQFADRDDLILSRPLIDTPFIFIKHREEDIELDELSDLKKISIAITKGTKYGGQFGELLPKLNTQMMASKIMNLKKVLHKRVKLFPLPLYEAVYLIKNAFDDQERDSFEIMLNPILEDKRIYLACSTTHPDCENIINKFNQGLAEVIDNGEKDRIVSEFLSLD